SGSSGVFYSVNGVKVTLLSMKEEADLSQTLLKRQILLSIVAAKLPPEPSPYLPPNQAKRSRIKSNHRRYRGGSRAISFLLTLACVFMDSHQWRDRLQSDRQPSAGLPKLQFLDHQQSPASALNSKTVERSFQCDRSNFCLQELRDNKAEGYVLQKFFDEWPKSQQEANGTVNYTSHPASSTHLSISIPGNLSSDFSLKLSTGNDAKKPRHASNNGGANGQLVCSGNNWSGWGHHGEEASTGGPLAEVLRSSASTHSPTSVLHKPNGSVSETSSISP
ncbi:hypothetical protein GW17_00041622, partial [Ensete ventricosum]